MKKVSGFTIDFIILAVFAFLLMIGLYVVNDIFPRFPRAVSAFIIIILIPVFWGTLICSANGKKTIGNIIANKKINSFMFTGLS